MHEWWSIGGDTFPKFRVNTPVGGWFPALQDLSWCITKSNLPHVDLFFSPHLKKVSIYASWSESTSEVSHEILPVIASTLSTLPVSTLQSLFFGVYPLAYFKDSFSSVVLRCGSPLTALASMIPLSGVATDHLIHLPQLRAWDISGPPPTYSALPLPLVFPPLVELTLEGGATREWFSLFERLEGHVRATQGVTPLSSVKESLETLCIKNCPSPIIDARFASPIQMFHNLITLSVETFRCNPNGERRCTFKLNNGDVTELAAALPRLEFLILGRPCPENTCTTTVACLLQISVHCVKLRTLDIHFNTANIIDGLKEISGDPRFPELRSLPRCALVHSDVFFTLLTVDEPSFTTVVNGKADIFPRLEHCEGSEPACIEFSKRLTRL